MAKKKKYEKVTEIVNYDKNGNIVTQKLTGNTGGYTRETTPALVGASKTVEPKRQTTTVEPTIKTNELIEKTNEPKEEKKTLKDAINNFDDTINNSAVKNQGFSLSHLISDAENLKDAKQKVLESVPIVGNLFKAKRIAEDTATNTMTNMGTGAIKTAEGAADTISDLVVNPWERRINYAADYLTKGKKVADENLKDLKKMQQRDIKKNMTQDFQDKTGYSNVVDDLEKNSLVKRENLGGQVAQGIGGMVPALVLGQAFGGTPELTNTAGLTGKEKAAAILGNVGKTYVSQLPSNAVLGASSYGSGVEEALNEGATMDQARKYGLANAAIEQGTEYLTGGIPGLGGKGGLDDVIEPLIDKTGKGYANALLKAGYGAFGEGLEEYAGAMLDPLAKKIYSDKPIDWKETNKQALQAGLIGAATGAILNSPTNIQDIQNARNEIRNQQAQRTQETPIQAPITQNNINTQEQIETTPTRQENEQINTQQVQTRVEPQTLETKPNQNYLENNQNMVYNDGINEKGSVENDFRQLQEASRGLSKEQHESLYSGDKSGIKGVRENISRVLQPRMENIIRSNNDNGKSVKNGYAETNGKDFHDVFEVNQPYLRNPDTVSVYEESDYKNNKNYLSEDGLSGFSITPSGDLISVFNNSGKPGMLLRIKDTVQSDAKTLDCFSSKAQDLPNLYQDAFGFKTASIMDFNYDIMAEEHGKEYADAFVEKYGEAPVYFMVKTDKNVTPKHFNKDQYSEAMNYRDGFVGSEGTSDSSNKNIAENKDNDVITIKNKSGQELKLKQNKNNHNLYEKEIPKPKDNKSIIPKETLEKQLLKLNDGTKISNFYTNITDSSKFITEDNAQKLSQEEIWKYAPQTNKETMKNAMAEIGETEQSVDNAYANFLSKTENFTPEDVAKGWIFLKRFQDAGNYDAMVQVAKKMRNIGTKSGQTVQMFNLQSRLTPEGMVKYAQSELMEAEQAYNKGKTKEQIEKHAKDFELTGDEVEYIKNQMEKIQNMEDGREKNIEMAKINKMLSDKLPHQKGDSIKAWMRISMLFNPKTQVRNIVGNALITPVNALADIPASLVDKAISRKTDVRTIGAPSLGGLATYGKGFVQGGKEAIQDYKMGIDTKDVDMSRFDITQGKPFVENHEGLTSVLNPFSKVGNKANDILDLVMSGGDRVFYQGAFESSLKNQMKLNNVDVPTQDMIDIATQEALSRTWNDNNGYTQFVLNTRRGLNKLNVGGYGIGDVLIPFAKTPANLTKAIVDYSPVGLASSIFKTKGIKNAIETGQITPQMQHEFAQNIGKGVAGTMLYLLAYGLAKNGVASGSKDDDKDVANFIKNTMGIQPYSIKIGDKSFTYDWAQPLAAPLAIVTDAYKNLSNKSDEDATTRIFNTILDVSNTGLNVLMQQSFLSGISEVLNDNEGVVNGIMNQVLSLPARGIPTLFKQINDMVDTTQRTAYENNRPLTTAKQNAMAKTPYSKKLAPSVDTLGREIPKYGGDKNKVTYAIKSFLSPANESNKRTTKTAEEIYSLYEATGDKTVMPRVAPYYVQNKEIGRVDLSSKDRAKYQKTSGKIVDEALSDLINDYKYQNLNDDQKVQVVSKIVGYADAKAKEQITGKISSYYSSADKKINNGMGIADYYLDKVK